MILSLRSTTSQWQLSPRGQEEEALTASSTFEAAKQLNAKQSGGISSTAASGSKAASDGSFDAVDCAAEKGYRQIQNRSCNAPQCAALCKIFFYCKIIIDPRCFLFFGFGVMLHLRLKSLTPGFLCSETISSATSVSVYPRIRAFVFRTSLCAHTSRKTAATSSAVT